MITTMQARSHISLEVSNLAAAIRFYSLVFRMAPTKQREDYANYRLETPALHLALEHRPDRVSGNPFANQHFGIELFEHEDLLSWRNWLQAVGVSYRVEEQVTCCYAVADKFWLTDPDGHEWEFWVRTDEADRMHDDRPETSGVDCCTPSPTSVTSQCNATTNATIVSEAIVGEMVSSCGTVISELVQSTPSSTQSSCCG